MKPSSTGFGFKTWASTQSKIGSIPRFLFLDHCLHRNNNWNVKPGHVHTRSSCCEKYVTCWLNAGDLTSHPGWEWRTKHSWEPSPRPPQPRVTQYTSGSLCPPSRCSTRLSLWTHLLLLSSAALNLQQIQRSLPKTACSSSETSSSICAKRHPSGPPGAPVPHPPSMPWQGAGTKGKKCPINSHPPLSGNPRHSLLLHRYILSHPPGQSCPSRAERSRYTPHSSEWAWQSLLVLAMAAFLCWSSDDVILSRSSRSLPLSLLLSLSECTCMRFPLRHGARRGESEAGKETVRAQTSTHICLHWTRWWLSLTFHVPCLFVLRCSTAKLLYSPSQTCKIHLKG